MKNLGQMLKQAQEMQAKMSRLKADLDAREVTGAAGGGMVQVTLNGAGQMRHLKIDPSLCKPEDAEVLEDLVLAAHNDAKSKVEAEMAQAMAEATSGLNLPPGIKLPF